MIVEEHFSLRLGATVCSLAITSGYPVGISTEFCFRWQKKSSRWEGEGDKERRKKKKKTGGKTEGEKKEEMEREKKKTTWERGRIEPPSRIDLGQESYALPVTYCDSQASL